MRWLHWVQITINFGLAPLVLWGHLVSLPKMGHRHMGMGQNKATMDRRLWPMLPLTGVPFGVPMFDPLPHPLRKVRPISAAVKHVIGEHERVPHVPEILTSATWYLFHLT